ncbi:hypothetical protein Tco_1472266 [Tanacetum coccineum]
MKNIEGTFTFVDQFLNDKPTKEEPGKANMETKVESMVIVPIHQASSSVPPLSTPIIDLTPPKLVSPPAQEPIFTATTATTTTTFPLPPPPRQQSTTDPDLANHVFALENRSTNFEEKHWLQDKKTKALASRVYNLKNHDLYSKIKKQFNEVVKEAVNNALQALLCDRFRDLSHPKHAALCEALEVSLQCNNNDEYQEALPTSRKRRHDDQDPPLPPPKESDRSKKKISSKQNPASPPPVDDNPIPNNMYLSYSKDTGAAHLPKIKTRPDWLKPLPEEEAPETPKPDWVIPPNDLPEIENNWVDALAKTYKDPEENKLHRKTRDMGSFINWYCKQIGKSKLVKADLEGPAYKLVKPFHKSSISLQFQREECHLLKEIVLSLWIESERDYNISTAYGISYWWFKRKEFYITRHSAPYNRNAVRSHMRILSVVSLKTYFIYGYTFLKEIVLCRADYKEYKISKADFKNLHPNDFEDLYLLHLQGKLNYLFGADKVHLFNAVNL